MSTKELLKQGERAMMQLRFEEAIAFSDEILRHDPSDVYALYLKAQALSNLGRFPESVALLDRILAIVPRESNMFWETEITKGNVLLDLDRLDDAERCFDEAIAIVPRTARTWIEKGRVAARRKDFARSLEYCERAASLDPNDPRAWNNKAFALLQLGRVDDCIPAAKKALELKPDYTTAWMWLAQAYEQKGDQRRAKECFDKVQPSAQGGMFFKTDGHKAPEPPPKKKWWQF